jgi:hypothetical protein
MDTRAGRPRPLAASARSGDSPAMRLVLAAPAKLAVALLLGLLVAACPTPQSPKGPPPEYEEPPAPSWLDGGAGGPMPTGMPSADAGADAPQ